MFRVECGRSKAQDGLKCFECGDPTWPWLLALGLSHGWSPVGTLYGRRPDGTEGRGRLPEDRQDYAPHDWYWFKIFLAEDARALSLALRRALETNVETFFPTEEACARLITTRGWTPPRSRTTQMSRQTAETFIAFLSGGEFDFAYDD